MTAGTVAPMWHEALVYRSEREYADGLAAFLEEALDTGRPAFVSVPTPHGALLRDKLGKRAQRVRWADMREVGANPNRILPAIQAFIDEHRHSPVSFIGEPIWHGRTEAEIAEATRHEALINHAFEGSGARVVCPYDAVRLDPKVVADAYRTHVRVWDRGGWRASDDYTDPATLWREVSHLPDPPSDAERRPFDERGVRPLRRRARRYAARVGLTPERTEDLLVAVTELSTNSVRHGAEPRTATLWTEDHAVVVQIEDGGHIADPLVGRTAPALSREDGRGLWMVNILSDLVQVHSDTNGTLVRIRLSDRR